MQKIKIICVVGATASGKTALAVEIARAVNGEVISADSMQVYRGMSVATAAATAEEQQGIPHHLLECLEPEEAFSVYDFVQRADTLIHEIHARGNVPVIAGGTGLFIDSLVKGIRFQDIGVDEALRDALSAKDSDTLYEELTRLDPAAAAQIHKNNRKRVIRALELCYAGSGKTLQNEASVPDEPPYDALYIGIAWRDRQKLYNRINLRVEQMVQNGLVEEAAQMRSRVGATAAQAIGHKELEPYFDGAITLEEAVQNIQTGTRHYAKRQMTWFRRNEQIRWLYADEMTQTALYAQAVDMAQTFLQDESR